jgi:hypothetical protein
MDRTNAERQRRYIARLKAQAKAGGSAALAAHVRELEAEVARLKAALARERREHKHAAPKSAAKG